MVQKNGWKSRVVQALGPVSIELEAIALYSILLTSYEDHVADKQLCLTCISSLNKVYIIIIIIIIIIINKLMSHGRKLYRKR